jgi:hypothetical protein
LVHRYSNIKYDSAAHVPDQLPVTQVNAAKDKGRAHMSIILIFVTIVGCLSTVLLAKYHKNSGKSTYTEDIMRGHAQYSKAHQEQLRTTFKER